MRHKAATLLAGLWLVATALPAGAQIPLPAQPAGTSTVSRQFASRADAHTTKGTFPFGVGARTPGLVEGVGAAPGREGGDPSTLLGLAARWALYGSFALLVGAAATGLAVFGGRLPARPERLLLAGLVLGCMGLALLVAEAKLGSGLPWARLVESAAGVGLLGRALALGVAALAVAAALAWPHAPVAVVGVGLAAAGGLLVHVLAGPAGAGLNLAVQWAHLLAVGIWVGGLAWLLRGLRGRTRQARVAASLRFSRLAAAALAVVVLTWLGHSLAELDGWRQLTGSAYGRTLLAELALITMLAGLAARNRWRVLPVLAAGSGQLARLRGTVRGELALAALVLAAAGLLSQLPPGASAASARPAAAAPSAVRVSGSDAATSVRLRLTVIPGTAGANRFQLQAADYHSGAPVALAQVRLTGRMPYQPRLAAATMDLEPGGREDRWQGQGRLLSVAGRWDVTASLATASGVVQVPLKLFVFEPPQRQGRGGNSGQL